MADWTSLLGALNGGVLAAFGREVTYLPLAGGSVDDPGDLRAGSGSGGELAGRVRRAVRPAGGSRRSTGAR